jgi:hypothetical protein
MIKKMEIKMKRIAIFLLLHFACTVLVFAQEKEYELGDEGPAGGLVFYDKGSYSDAWRYLEAAPAETEWSDIEWEWKSHGQSIGRTSTDVGSGKSNTKHIAAFLKRTRENGRAAQECESLEYGGYDDWFLPSADELNLMYENLHTQGLGGFADSHYWSSSEHPIEYAWYQDFTNGKQNYIGKYYPMNVRAVRAF